MITDIHDPKYKKALSEFERKCIGAQIDYALVYLTEEALWQVVPLQEAKEKNLSIVLVCLCHRTIEEKRNEKES